MTSTNKQLYQYRYYLWKCTPLVINDCESTSLTLSIALKNNPNINPIQSLTLILYKIVENINTHGFIRLVQNNTLVLRKNDQSMLSDTKT